MSQILGHGAMTFGLGVAQLGRFAEPSATRNLAVRAEAAGFSSLWAIDRLLSPIHPRSKYPVTPDGALPDEQHRALDPLVTLTVAATVTERIRLGTNVLVAPWYPPVLLARSLATLDRVSDGRLNVGLGIGWSVDEYEAVGAPMRRRGERLDEVLDVLAAQWQDTAARLDTSRESVAPAHPVTRPVQEPHPPILLAAYTPAGLDRIARRADGWMPTGIPLDIVASMWSTLLATAERNGRDHTRLQLVVRGDPKIQATPLGRDRAPFHGSWEQHRFAQFTEWPDSALSDGSPLTMCVVGDTNVMAALERTVRGISVSNRVVEVKFGRSDAPPSACQILYVSGVSSAQATRVVAGVRDAPVLTISDLETFDEMGGIIELFYEAGQLRFSLDTDAAKRSGLQLSSRLLQLSRPSR